MNSKLTQHLLIRGRKVKCALIAIAFLTFGGVAPQVYASPATQAQKAASSPITGKVVTSDGEPVIGATVMVNGTSVGAVTDLEGNFSIKGASS